LDAPTTKYQYRHIKGFSLGRGSANGGGEGYINILAFHSTSSVFALRQIHLLLKEKAFLTQYLDKQIVGTGFLICTPTIYLYSFTYKSLSLWERWLSVSEDGEGKKIIHPLTH
jgi:hypothetical protein